MPETLKELEGRGMKKWITKAEVENIIKSRIEELQKREQRLTADCLHIKKVKCNKPSCSEIVKRKHKIEGLRELLGD